MEFADKLKQIRKARKLSQEDLAGLLDVSRQAVSKWEQGAGYPEVEKLLVLSNKLNVSLDILMGIEIPKENIADDTNVTENIVITSFYENVIAACYRVFSSQEMKGKKESPKYALIGVSNKGKSFWGEPTIFLGWYADKENISKEIIEIQNALEKGILNYKLKYSVKVKRHLMSLKMVTD